MTRIHFQRVCTSFIQVRSVQRWGKNSRLTSSSTMFEKELLQSFLTMGAKDPPILKRASLFSDPLQTPLSPLAIAPSPIMSLLNFENVYPYILEPL